MTGILAFEDELEGHPSSLHVSCREYSFEIVAVAADEPNVHSWARICMYILNFIRFLIRAQRTAAERASSYVLYVVRSQS